MHIKKESKINSKWVMPQGFNELTVSERAGVLHAASLSVCQKHIHWHDAQQWAPSLFLVAIWRLAALYWNNWLNILLLQRSEEFIFLFFVRFKQK